MSERESRTIGVLGIRPVHPGSVESSRIELTLTLDYLKGSPLANVVLSSEEALRLAEQALVAVRIVKGLHA